LRSIVGGRCCLGGLLLFSCGRFRRLLLAFRLVRLQEGLVQLLHCRLEVGGLVWLDLHEDQPSLSFEGKAG